MITAEIPTQKSVPDPDDDPCGHLTECEWCDECEALMNFFMACDFCGHWGHMDSDGWFLGHINDHGAAQVYCSEECCAKNGDTLADEEARSVGPKNDEQPAHPLSQTSASVSVERDKKDLGEKET